MPGLLPESTTQAIGAHPHVPEQWKRLVPSSALPGEMLPADGDELPRVRRAAGSLKKLGLGLQFHSLFLLAEAGGHRVK